MQKTRTEEIRQNTYRIWVGSRESIKRVPKRQEEMDTEEEKLIHKC